MKLIKDRSTTTKLAIGVIFVLLSVASLSIGVKSEVTLDLLLTSRLPRLIAIIASGSGMAIAGLIMQSITQNRFVSPTTAGTLSFARLGLLLSLLLLQASSLWTRLLFTFVVTLLGSLTFIKAIDKIKMKNLVFVPLFGIMIGSVVDSITTFLSLRFDLNQLLTSWTAGSFTLIIKGRYELLYVVIGLIFLAYVFAKEFTIVAMGEHISINLGVDYAKTVRIGLLLVSLISASVLTTVGSIPFVGLVIPNLVSLLVGDRLEDSLWLTAIGGALFVLCADVISRLLIYPYEIPISATIGVLGSIIFLLLLLRKVNHAH